ncbi:ergothioneine biosynthesis protein EgtC [Nocardia panacis]|uniref:Gamma-glutamyl-hercynylcysteine sulfoxide hydrolase n=1 Tax=Nocardia panacis TaxID=2340916 RepID=A0A3A4K5Q5_9NOCA|nr:ergothioneine biosynthesis protein EgtC [Nocardia panacis]RJO76339.1 ergothioneine biosynthesis protein EgtC [Nocardia panacis]
MCRHIGYVGAPLPVGEILTRGTHSLRVQSYAPAEMRSRARVNADGFGAAWWHPASGGAGSQGQRNGHPRVVAARYRNAAPIWTDPAVDEVLVQLVSRGILGAIRSATSGMPVERAACAPFVDGVWAFSHNGHVPDWRAVLTAVCADLDALALRAGSAGLFAAELLLTAESPTDSATVWTLLARLLRAEFVAGPAEALRLLCAAILAHAPTSRLNFLLSDGETLWATTVHHSLYALLTPESAILSSEPYDDDPAWLPIEDRQLVCARPGELSSTPLAAEPNDPAAQRDSVLRKGQAQ